MITMSFYMSCFAPLTGKILKPSGQARKSFKISLRRSQFLFSTTPWISCLHFSRKCFKRALSFRTLRMGDRWSQKGFVSFKQRFIKSMSKLWQKFFTLLQDNHTHTQACETSLHIWYTDDPCRLMHIGRKFIEFYYLSIFERNWNVVIFLFKS